MIEIGITYNPSTVFHENGRGFTAFILQELFAHLGDNYKVYFINHGDPEKQWWDDTPHIIDDYSCVHMYSIHKNDGRKLDLLIDIDCVLQPAVREKIAKQTVAFLRSFLQFSELDKSVYNNQSQIRNFGGVSEVWVWDILNPPETLDSVGTLFPCPIKRVPFIWSSRHIRSIEQDIPSNTTTITEPTNNPIHLHIYEKNKDNTSSCVLPLVAIPEIKRRGEVNVTDYTLFCTKNMMDNKFFVANVLNNIQFEKHGVHVVNSKPKFIELCNSNDTVIVLSHSRFVPLRIGLLDLLWLGIPLIHNSSVISDLHHVLKSMAYESNSITGMCEALKWIDENTGKIKSSIHHIRTEINNKWSVAKRADEWRGALSSIWCAGSGTGGGTGGCGSSDGVKAKNIVIGYYQMWPGFNCNSNFFMSILRNEVDKNGLNITFTGVEYSTDCRCDVVMFGPHSKNLESIRDNVPKIYFSAENWGAVSTKPIDLMITSYSDEKACQLNIKNNIQLPTWMSFIDWFSGSKELPVNHDDNPILMPIHFATIAHLRGFDERNEFCGFVVSNPCCKIRNETFFKLNEYKRVNSGGALYNNIGGQLNLKYPGGGCGDVSKHKFLSLHRFHICFENSQSSGYITEKLIHSKMAGCVPIYWGDAGATDEFARESFINVSHLQTAEEVCEIIKNVESNEELCRKMASTPLIDTANLPKYYSILSNVARNILRICGVEYGGSDERDEKKVSEEKVAEEKVFDKVVVINLDKRTDRWQRWLESNPKLAHDAMRFSAVDGRTLRLTREIYGLFKANRFGWKKSVIGCALSHIGVWRKLANDKDSAVDSYLILEDDMIFTDEKWDEKWKSIKQHIPRDAELLYLGGVLPTNKAALTGVLEPINNYWSIIKPNTLFGSSVPLPLFHFCAYSYILTRSGARKLLDWFDKSSEKCFAEIDHVLGHPIINLKKYVLSEMITGCFQELEDTTYRVADFNSTSVKAYDSDICNNTECFGERDFQELEMSHNNKTKTIYYVVKDKDDNANFILEDSIYEYNWLEYLFNKPSFMPIKLSMGGEDDCVEETINNIIDIQNTTNKNGVPLWFLVTRPHMSYFNKLFRKLDTLDIIFNVLHLADEFFVDDITFYGLGCCKSIVRNYWRKECINMKKVTVIPLGYHHSGEDYDNSFDERELAWCFHGTNWFNRKEICDKLVQFAPYDCHFTPEWNHLTMTNEMNYTATLQNSKFCPIIRGNNSETFRLYECLENGVIPIYVRADGDELLWKWLSKNMCLLEISDWDKAVRYIEFLLQNPDRAEQYRVGIISKWREVKDEYVRMISKL